MQITTIPPKFSIPWAGNAGSSYIRQIPLASQTGVTPGAASLADGFPPLTFMAIAAGGIPPSGEDMNGILNQITQWLRWYQAGAPNVYDSAFQAAIGGYPYGSVIQSVVTGLLWRCAADGNMTNPDSGGNGWTLAQSGRINRLSTITTNMVYTPSSSGVYEVEFVLVGGGGAGGGGYATTGITAYGVGSGGASGGILFGRVPVATVAGQQITVGGGGIGVAGQTGGNGGTTSFGSVASAPGGGGGGIASIAIGQTTQAGQGPPGPAPTSAAGVSQYSCGGQPGQNGIVMQSGIISGQGAPSPLGGGGGLNTNGGNGGNATGPGAGGGGGATLGNQSATPGGGGGIGVVMITEFYG